jgi:tetratricopeptide (TPR) repeat protein
LKVVHIQVAPLAEKASQELARELLRQVQGVPSEVVRLIVDRSEGVPYFAEELVNLLIDRGLIDRQSEPWRFTAEHVDASELPQTLQHLLLTRLLALPAAEHACLVRGSIFGRNFWDGALQALGIREPRVLLNRLQMRGFVEAQAESSFEGESEWTFHHNLLREVTYESVLKRERPAMHKAAGAWLQAQARQAGRIDEFVGILGEHAERAGELSAAADWYLRAGERAYGQGALAEARRFFERALELLPPADAARRWRALLGRNDVIARLGDSAVQFENVNALLELAKALDDNALAEAHYRQSLYMDGTANYRIALQECDIAYAAAQRANNAGLLVRLLGMKAIWQGRLGEVDAATATAQEILMRAREIDEATAVKALSNLAVYFVESGDLARAAQLHTEQASIAYRLGDRYAEANARLNLGYDYVLLGMYAEGVAASNQAVKLQQAIGVRRDLNYARLNLALAYWRNADIASARQLLESMRDELSRAEDAFARAARLSYLGLVLEQSGELQDARACFIQAAVLFKSNGIASFAVDAIVGLGRCALVEDDLEQAHAHAIIVWDHLQQRGTQGMEFPIRAYLTCAEIFDALGTLSTTFEEELRFDDMSRAAVAEGYRELMQRAERITNPEWRDSFLDNVPEHRAIIARWQQLSILPLSQ